MNQKTDFDGNHHGTEILSKQTKTNVDSNTRSQALPPPTRQRGNFLIEVIRNQSINVENIKFRDKEQWIDSDFCSLCECKYTIMFVTKHHCRLCGESVCKECSQKKINEQRVCDFCFLKCSDHKQARRRNNDLSSVLQQIETLKTTKNKYTDNIIHINKQIFDNQELQKEELKQFALEEGELQNKEKKLLMKVEQLKEDNVQQKTQTQNLEKDSSTNKNNITELTNQINKLKLDIDSVKNSIEMKNTEIENIKQLLRQVQNSESFKDLSIIRSGSEFNQSQQNNRSTIYFGNQMESIIEEEI